MLRKQRGFTFVGLMVLAFAVYAVGAWVLNAYKLASCDFEANYRCELIHGVGFIAPPLSIVTVWFGDDGA